MESLKNFGVQVLRAEAATDEPITVIVVGMERSGTTMVAKMLESMGICMGSRRDAVVFEDKEIADLLETGFNKKTLLSMIAQRNEQYGTWGFKRPRAVEYIRKYEKYFRNVHYIIPFRDVLAIANRHVLALDGKVIAKMKGINRRYDMIIKFAATSKRPCFMFSYEKALIKQESFVTSLASFLKLSPSAEIIQRAMTTIEVDNPLYLFASRGNRTLGNVAPFEGGVLKGWAKQENSDAPVTLEIQVNSESVFTGPANDFRQDLADQQLGDGHHGFAINIEKYLVAGQKNVINVINTRDGLSLPNSPQIVVPEEA